MRMSMQRRLRRRGTSTYLARPKIGIAAEVARSRGEQWLAENRAAIASSNKFVEKHGLPLEKYRRFECRVMTFTPTKSGRAEIGDALDMSFIGF